MIGIYIQNPATMEQLIFLLRDYDIEKYCPDHVYDLVLWLDETRPDLSQTVPVLTLKDIKLPLSLSEWRLLIQMHHGAQTLYENDLFIFDAHKRTVYHKPTQNIIFLTEKENDFLSFLMQQPNRCAPKEALLQSVWQYSPEAETHTVESHLYALKQKLGPDADALIQNSNGQIELK